MASYKKILESLNLTEKRPDNPKPGDIWQTNTGFRGVNQTGNMQTFSDKDKAIKFANNNNIDFVIIEPKKRKIKPKSYSDNFSPDRKTPWTH